MRFIRINGELAEVVPLSPSRAKLVYLAGQPEDALPSEVEYLRVDQQGGFGRRRVVLKNSNVLLVEGVQQDFGDSLDAS